MIQLADIGDGVFRDKSNRHLTHSKAIELNCSFLKKGDVLIARMPEPLGRACIFPLQEENKYVTAVDVCILRIDQNIAYNKFIGYIINSPCIRAAIAELESGTTRKRISRINLGTIDFPLPPLPEQYRIVAKIEELFSELDKGVEALKTAQQQLKVYRQAVLKWAFEGKLTEEWRKQQSSLPTGTQLLEQIKTEREKQAKATGKKLKPVRPLTEEELAELPAIPDVWNWARPVEICSDDLYSIGIGPFGSNLKVSDYQPSGVPLIFVKNITRNDFALDLKFISQGKFKELTPHSVLPLDILITKMGDPPGDCTIYPEDRPIGIITSDCLKFRVNGKYTDRKFIKYCMETNLIKKQFGLITKGVAQKKISAERFKSIIFPFPSKEEQQQIVQEIESRLSVADKLDEAITQSLQQAEALRQSILKKAFEGRLVPQDPNDEPASALLSRIKAERENSQAEKAPRRQPRKTNTKKAHP